MVRDLWLQCVVKWEKNTRKSKQGGKTNDDGKYKVGSFIYSLQVWIS